MLDILSYEEKTVFKLRSLYERYGYRPYKVSKFEEYDLYAENKRFLDSGNIITFTDLGGRLMALKPDVTLSIIKNYNDQSGAMEKLCYDESVYRSSGYDGGYQEITQTGLECIGALDSYTISEVIGLAAESLGIIRDDYVLDVSHMGFVAGLFEEMGLSEQQSRRLLKYLSQKNVGEMREKLRVWGVDEGLRERACALAGLYGKLGDKLEQLEAISVNEKTAAACGQLRELYELLSIRGCGDRVYLDFSIASETEYYNGVTFKGFVDGVPTAVLSGGRYDGLMEKLGKKAGAIGFAVYLNLLERLFDPGKQFDVDVLLCYEEDTPPTEVSRAVKRLSLAGYSVRAQKGSAGGIRCKKVMKMSDAGVEELEENA